MGEDGQGYPPEYQDNNYPDQSDGPYEEQESQQEEYGYGGEIPLDNEELAESFDENKFLAQAPSDRQHASSREKLKIKPTNA